MAVSCTQLSRPPCLHIRLDVRATEALHAVQTSLRRRGLRSTKAASVAHALVSLANELLPGKDPNA